MKIHEFQAKDLLRAAGVPVLAGQIAKTPEDAAAAYTALGTPVCAVKAQIHAGKDSPVNGTSATIARRMSGSRAGFLRLPRQPRPESGSLDGPPRPPEVAFFLCRRGVSPSPAASRLCRDLASCSVQRLWMSIAGGSWGDA
jgi:hypothetical protein